MIGWMVILVFNNVLKNIQILSQVGSDNLHRSVQSKELQILMKNTLVIHITCLLIIFTLTFPEENLLQIIVDLLLTDTETTAVSLRWLLLYLIHNPDIQQKCQNEIYEVKFFKIISHEKKNVNSNVLGILH